MNGSREALLEIRGLTKRFPGVTALEDVDLELHAGRIHALVGENGAGKSTLIRILCGLLPADEGRIRLEGREATIRTPIQARRLGIATVHQNAHLIPDLTVAENLALSVGYPRSGAGFIRWKDIRRRASAILADAPGGIDPSVPAGRLGAIEQTLVEIAFALAQDPKILVLDEPTAGLPQAETENLLARLRDFAGNGGAVLFVSHRLEEIFRIADEITVLRDGRRVKSAPAGETSADDLIRAMVGREVSSLQRRRGEPPAQGEEALRISGLDDAGGAFHGISLTIGRGEIFGLYGLVGAGQAEFCRTLLGVRTAAAGEVRIGDRALETSSPKRRVRSGLGYVPAERRKQGIFYPMTVGENLTISSLNRCASFGWIRRDEERRISEDAVRRLRIKTRGIDQGVSQLSGGNQQKVLLGRWLSTEPGVLVLEEPTQGVDVGAKAEIHRIILRLAREGVAVLLVTSELPELFALSDRIGVIRQGRLVLNEAAGRLDEETVLRAALPVGSSPSGAEEDPARRSGRSIERAKGGGAPSAWVRTVLSQRETGLALFLLATILVCSFFLPAFATWENLRDLLVNNVILLIGALGISFVIIAGGIDISIGAILGLAAVNAALCDKAGLPGWVLAATALGVGGVLGAANGTTTVLARVHSIVITLGTLSIYRGLLLQQTGGRWILNLSDRITGFGQGRILGIPVLLVFGLAAVAVAQGVLRRTVLGRRFYAFGSHPGNAVVHGISAWRVTPAAFALCGVFLGAAGLLQAGRYGQVQTNIGLGFELKAIAAAVIGGTYIMGGRGSPLGTLLGSLLIGVTMNVLVLSRLSAFWENVVVGSLILLAVLADETLAHRGKTES